MKYLLMLLLATVSQTFAQSDRSLIRDGSRSYKEKTSTDAEIDYRKALEKNREFREGPFNLGDALYKQERFAEAAEQYNIAATRATDPVDKAQALHNLGNALLKSQKFPESIGAYKEALKQNPRDMDTKYNLEYAKRMLKQQQQQQQQKKGKGKDDKQQEKKKKEEDKKDQQPEEQRKDQQQSQKEEQARKKQQISKEDAERILEALKNEEKDVQKKIHRKVPGRVR